MLAVSATAAMAAIIVNEGDGRSSGTPHLPVFAGYGAQGHGLLDWPGASIMIGPQASRTSVTRRAIEEMSPALAGRWMRLGGTIPAAPTRDPRAVSRTSGDVLGSVALQVSHVPQLSLWRTLLEERADAYFFDGCTAPGCDGKLMGRLSEAVAIARGQNDRDAIDTINKAVNAGLAYRRDLESHGTADHWATMAEILASGSGDCEEFAALKMWMLRAADFDVSQLRLQLVRLLRTGEDHAVLVVDIGSERLVLDNLTTSARGDAQVKEYRPMLSFVGDDAFVHGFRRGADRSGVAGSP